jgi:hypothetical protein
MEKLSRVAVAVLLLLLLLLLSLLAGLASSSYDAEQGT